MAISANHAVALQGFSFVEGVQTVPSFLASTRRRPLSLGQTLTETIEGLYSNSTPVERWTARGIIERRDVHISVNVHFDIGTCKIPEDSIALSPDGRYISVADGVSPGYVPGSAPKEINGVSYGRYAAEVLSRSVKNALETEPITSIVTRANRILASDFAKCGCQENHPADYGATTAAICNLDYENKVAKLMSWGDAYFVVYLKSGGIVVSKNLVYAHDQEQNEIRAALEARGLLDKEKLWREFIPTLMMLRNQRINNFNDVKGYGVLNGTGLGGLLKLASEHEVPFRDIEKILLATDGVVDIDQSHPADRFRNYMETFRSVTDVEEFKRASYAASIKRNDKTQVALPEASGVLLTFA
jgi:hypothetical protein